MSAPITLNFTAEGLASVAAGSTVAVGNVPGLTFSGNVSGMAASLNPDLLPAAWGGYLLGSNNFTITVLAGYVFDTVALDYAVGDPNGITWTVRGILGGSVSATRGGSQIDPWPSGSSTLALTGDTISSITFLTASPGFYFGIDNIRLSLVAAAPAPAPAPAPSYWPGECHPWPAGMVSI